VSKIVDLTDGNIRRRLKVSESRMLSSDWRNEVARGRVALTQLLGQAAFDVGLEGLLVPSATGGAGTNLVIFPANLLSSSSLVVVGGDELRR